MCVKKSKNLSDDAPYQVEDFQLYDPDEIVAGLAVLPPIHPDPELLRAQLPAIIFHENINGLDIEELALDPKLKAEAESSLVNIILLTTSLL